MSDLKLLITGSKGRMGQAIIRAAEAQGVAVASTVDVGDALAPALARTTVTERHPFGPIPLWSGREPPVMSTILWIIAVVLVIAGILALFRRQLVWGAVLIIVGLLVGPGGVSIFT